MKVRSLSLCALFAALMCVCAWLCIPMPDIAITMQTFALFLSLALLGGKRGSIVCLVYLLLGSVGLPVFSGFRGGMGILLGATGGYITGFLAAALAYWAVTAVFGDAFRVRLLASLLGLSLCYGFGTAWFLGVYMGSGSALDLSAVLLKCVIPYVLPDLGKLALAMALAKRLKPFIHV